MPTIGISLSKEELSRLPDRAEGVEYRWHPVFSDYVIGSDGGVYRGTVHTGEVFRERAVYYRMKGHWLRAKKYLQYSLGLNGEKFTRRAHQLVLTAFRGEAPLGFQGAHLDGTKTNHRLDNLIWATPKVNQGHRDQHGTRCNGTDLWSAKLTPEDVLDIRSLSKFGASLGGLANAFGVSSTQIANVLSRKSWKHLP